MCKWTCIAIVATFSAGQAVAQFVRLHNGTNGDGALEVNPDAYGSVNNGFGATGNHDSFDPAGAPGPMSYVFASAAFIYMPDVFDQTPLAEEGMGGFDSYYAASLQREVLTPISGTDTDGNGELDRATSTVRVFGGLNSVNLRINLVQSISGTSFRQSYEITNTTGTAVSFLFNTHWDMDLLLDGDFADAAGTAAGIGGLTVYQREPDEVEFHDSVMISASAGTPGYVYYAARSGADPDGDGGDPAMAYGTDLQIWNNCGVPASWQNYTAFIGHDTPGIDGRRTPPGGIFPYDGFMGYQWSVELGAGASRTISVTTNYALSGGCITCDTNCDGSVNGFDIQPFIEVLSGGSPCSDCAGDTNSDGSINGFDIQPFIECLGG